MRSLLDCYLVLPSFDRCYTFSVGSAQPSSRYRVLPGFSASTFQGRFTTAGRPQRQQASDTRLLLFFLNILGNFFLEGKGGEGGACSFFLSFPSSMENKEKEVR